MTGLELCGQRHAEQIGSHSVQGAEDKGQRELQGQGVCGGQEGRLTVRGVAMACETKKGPEGLGVLMGCRWPELCGGLGRVSSGPCKRPGLASRPSRCHIVGRRAETVQGT